MRRKPVNQNSTQDGFAPRNAPQAGSSAAAEEKHEHLHDSELPPPEYEEVLEEVRIEQEDFNASAKILDDGRVNISIGQNQRRLSTLFAPAFEDHLRKVDESKYQSSIVTITPSQLRDLRNFPNPPRLNLVIHVVGSRGDVQPFIALGRVLKEIYHHRVRLATHPVFQSFIEENGLEFFSIGGDPAALMAFMVKNPGMMPSMDSMRKGDIGRHRREIYEIMKGCWRSCWETGDGVLDESEELSQIPWNPHSRMRRREFVADAIIANPPSFAHVHCAQKLGIPLHMMFTMPWSATQSFPHPLANIQPSNVDIGLKNFMSYPMVEMMMWQGLGGTINMFRSKVLDLEPIRTLWGPKGVSSLQTPYTYMWSPSLIPKPDDWGNHISVTGFPFLSLASSYTPDNALQSFLDTGSTPVYIGFGSIVVDNPQSLVMLIFEAVRQTGRRALVSSGWGGLTADTVPDNIYIVGNVPHDWLFDHVSCVVHHGGAGTAAAGIRLGKPTVVVPFFGDQFFWGSMIARAGAGPKPIPFRQLTASNLAMAIQSALDPHVMQQAIRLGKSIEGEQGAEMAAFSFHHQLNSDGMRCSLDNARIAVWRVRKTDVKLCALAATILIDAGLIKFKDLKSYRPREYDLEGGPWDPITGAMSAVLDMVGNMMLGFADVPVEIIRARRKKGKENENAAPAKDVQMHESQSEQGVPTGPHELASGVRVLNQDAQPVGNYYSIPDIAELPGSVTLTLSTPPSREPPSPPSSRSRSLSSITPSQQSHGQYAPSLAESLTTSTSTSIPPLAPKSLSSTTTFISPSTARTRATTVLQVSHAVALGTSKGVGRILAAGLKSPFEVTLSVARGFHNAPRLYGDESVRQQERITGVWSGLRAAGKGFTFGMYDGISGLVTQPIDGARKEGATGLLKGIGKGFGGLALKPTAGGWGLAGYTWEGVHKEVQKLYGANIEGHIIASRKAQGFEQFKTLSEREKRWFLGRWEDGDVVGLRGGKAKRVLEKKEKAQEKEKKKAKENGTERNEREVEGRAEGSE